MQSDQATADRATSSKQALASGERGVVDEGGAPAAPLIFQHNRSAWLCLSLLYASLWLLGHGYLGLHHDARLYALQALSNLDREAYASDLFLAYGSQDQFTLFTKLTAPMVDALGLGAVVRLLSTVGSLLWWAVVLAFAAMLLPGQQETRQQEMGQRQRGLPVRKLGIFFLLALPAYYGAIEIFAIGRALATPRVLSEALVILGLITWCRQYADGASLQKRAGQWLLTAICIAVAAALHPLMALAGAVVCAIEWAIGGSSAWTTVRRRWLVLVATVFGIAALLGLALLGLAPFDRLLTSFDPAWLQVVELRSEHVFLSGWEARDWSRVAVLALVSLAAATLMNGWRRRLAIAVVLAALLGIALNGLGADLLHNVLLTQLQLFRLAWPLHLLGPLLGGVVLAHALRRWQQHRSAVALLGLGVVLAWVGLDPLQAFVAVAVTATGLLLILRSVDLGPRQRRDMLWGASVVSVVLLLLIGFTKVQNGLQGVGLVDFRWSAEIFHARSMPQFLLGAAMLPILFWRPRRTERRVLVVIAALLCVGTASLLDQRTTIALAAEQRTGSESATALIPKGQSVFWQNEVALPWFWLQRPSYLTRDQAAGVVFNRGTALEYSRRLALVGSWDADYHELFSDGASLPPARARAVGICSDQAAPYALILGGTLPDIDLQPLRLQIPGLEPHFLYLCLDLLALEPAAASEE